MKVVHDGDHARAVEAIALPGDEQATSERHDRIGATYPFVREIGISEICFLRARMRACPQDERREAQCERHHRRQVQEDA